MTSVPENIKTKYEDKLEELAGTRDFAQAAQTREGLKALARMMNDSHLEDVLRGYVHIPSDLKNPDQHIADQYAELVNTRRSDGKPVLDPRAIVLKPNSIKGIAERYYRQRVVVDNAMPRQDDQITQQRQLPSSSLPRRREPIRT
jgi:hypothetical protein